MAIAGLLALSACHHSPPWVPYEARYERMEPTTERAAVVYQGDLSELVRAGATFMGEMRASSVNAARERSASVGATHIYFVKPGNERLVMGPNVVRTVTANRYAVFVLPRTSWRTLPSALRPVPLECYPLPPLEEGCSYTHYLGPWKYDAKRMFVQCGDHLTEVTDKLDPDTCPLYGG